jgi:hypothetical protein
MCTEWEPMKDLPQQEMRRRGQQRQRASYLEATHTFESYTHEPVAVRRQRFKNNKFV